VFPVAERRHLEGVVDGRRDRAEEPEGRPDHDDAAAEPEGDLALAEGVELDGDEVELAGKVLKDEAENGGAIVIVGAHPAKYRQAQEQKGKQREQRVEGDRGGERQVVAAVEADEAVPRRPAHEAGQALRGASDAPPDTVHEGG
jgi:hypothetical protein